MRHNASAYGFFRARDGKRGAKRVSEAAHLSLHCLPMRPGSSAAMRDHFLAPYLATSSTIFSSSCRHDEALLATSPAVVESLPLAHIHCRLHHDKVLTSLLHCPFTSSGFRTFCHLCKH